MDHVPYPENLALPLMEIDYLCCDIEAYDGLGFLDYPTRRGWTQTAGSSQWINCSSQIAAKRAQNWLYFGFLHEIFGSDYSLENFLRPNPNKAGFLVSTRQLPELLSRFNSRSLYQRLTPIFGLNRSVNLDFVDRSRPLCLEVNLQSDLLDRLSEDCRPITLSIKVLLESIQTAICNIERDEGQSIMVTNRVFPTRLTYSRMVEAGWCPKQAAHLASYSVIGAHYLAAIQRKSFGSDHGKCKGSVCVANNVDEKQYKVAHIEDHCQCQFYGPESAKVIKIMKDGNIPLISITVTVDGDPRLQVLEASPGLRYTAISHVWIGGLGNFFENQLPRCQLLQIRSLLKNLKSYKPQHGKSHTVAKPTRLFTAGARIMKILISYLSCLCLYQRNDFGIGDLELSSLEEIDPVVFWMDTLCIPVGDENALLRADAINKMDLIYAGARDVLVLDPELQQIPLEGLPQEEISAHILCSPWMTRCWTLQEARLSSNWYAQFADGIFDPRSAHSRLIKDIVSFFGFNNVYDDLRGLKHEMFNEWYYRQLPKRNTSELGLTLVIDDVFSFEWNNLVQRSTTKKEDVHCILANMLGLSAGEVLALHYEERMKAILCTQAMLPLGLLFNEGPRVQDVDNGWVPLYPEEVLDSKLGNMKVTANGLLFDHSLGRCEGFAVSSSVPPPAKVCLCDTSNSNSELLWATPVANDPSQGFDVPIRIATCYILGGDGKSKLAQRDRVGRALIGARVGARFALQRSEGRILHLVYEHPVKFRYSAKDYDANNGLIEDGSSWPRANTEKLPTDQVYQLGCGKFLLCSYAPAEL